MDDPPIPYMEQASASLSARTVGTPRPPLVRPSAFFEVHVQEIDIAIPLLGLCAGFEDGTWRAEAFARHLMDYLPEFALTRDEWTKINVASAVRALRRAAQSVYTTKKYENRGEVGELLLHAVMREYYGSEPIVSKFFFKNASNDTVKGFDAVHVIFEDVNEALELWLGEVKLYTDIDDAIRDVSAELELHTSSNYLRSEFMWIENKLPVSVHGIERVRKLLNESTTLDKVFDVLHVPVLLTYESQTVRGHTKTTKSYIDEFKKELAKYHAKFAAKVPTKKIQIHLCLVPLKNKKDLLDRFDALLRGQQGTD